MRLSRRSFLKLGVGGGSVVALAGVSKLVPGGIETLDTVGERVVRKNMREEWLPSVCNSCPGVCKLLLRRIEGNICGVRPLGKSKPCARAYVIQQEIYHPDRVKAPLKRSKDRGADSWVKINKKDAVAEIAKILHEYGNRTAFIVREDSGLSFDVMRALASAAGSPYVFTYESVLEQGPVDALEAVSGWKEWRIDMDKGGNRGIVSFGWDWLQNFPDKSAAQGLFLALRQNNAPMVTVSSRYNLTAMKSRRWISCTAGFESLMAVALSSMLLNEKAYDSEFCGSVGDFDRFTSVVSGVNLKEISSATNVSEKQMSELLDILIQHKPVCLGPRGRFEDQWPVVLLNMLLGNIGVAGGIVPASFASLPVKTAEVNISVEEVPDEALKKEGSIDALVFVGVNPLISSPSPSRWRSAIHSAKRVVTVTSMMNETSLLSDLVVPMTLPAEQREVYISVSDDGRAEPVLVEPAVDAQPGLFSPSELAFSVAAAMGSGVENRFPWKNLDEAIRSATVSEPKQLSYRVPHIKPWAPPDLSGSGDMHLIVELPSSLPRFDGAHHPYLLTTVAPHLREWWKVWVEVNPETAGELGINDGDNVVIESEVGAIEARARYFNGIAPDTVCMPLGVGRTTGQFAPKKSSNPAELIALRQDNETGIVLWNLQKVRLRGLKS